MLKKKILATAMTVALASPALAHHCPKDAAAIDHALSVMNVSADVKSSVKAMRDKGMAEHKAGKHTEAETTLAEAMRTLLNAAK
jgi:hypothetical protein